MSANAPDVTNQSERQTPNGRWSSHVCWALALLVALSTALDLFFFNGYLVSDDQQYMRGGLAVLAGAFGSDGPSLGEMRLPLSGWNALVIALVGPRVQLVAASYVLFHQALNLATFLLGARLFGTRVGLLAAHLSVMTPLLLSFSTLIMPDIPQALWITLSLLTFLESYGWRARRRWAPAALMLLLAGVSAGLAYATKESGLIVLPFCFVLWIALERRHARAGQHRRAWIRAIGYGTLFATGLVAIFIAETIVLSRLNDDLLIRMAWTKQDLAQGRVDRIERVSGLDPLTRLQRVGDLALDDTYLPATLRALILLGLIGYPLLRTRPWSLYLLPIWMLVYLTWGTMNLSRYIPPILHLRYFTILLPFLFVITSATLWRLLELGVDWISYRPVRGSLKAIAVAAVLVLSLTWLQTPNEVAGGLSRARLVSAATRAIARAQQSSTRPIVMSGTVSNVLENLLVDQQGEQLLPSGDVTCEQLCALGEDGGFEYVELDERVIRGRKGRRDRQVQVTTLDELLHPLIHRRGDCLTDEFPWADAWVGWEISPAAAPRFLIGDYIFHVHERLTASRAATRLEDVWALIGNEVPDSTRPRSPRHAIVYRVNAKRVERALAGESADAGVAVDLASTIGTWRVWRTKDYRIEREGERPGRVSIQLGESEYAWYVLPKTNPDGVRELQRAGPWTIAIDFETQGDVALQLWLRFFADPDLEQNLMHKYVSLRPGRNRMMVFAPSAPVYFYPAFRITGSGTFLVDSFLITHTQGAREIEP